MSPDWRRSFAIVVFVAWPAVAHDFEHHHPIVIDTDIGMDDAVALALALQHPAVDIAAIVACEGVAGRERGVEYLERMLDLFNRKEIRLYAPAETHSPRPAPPFRSMAEGMVGEALPDPVAPFHRSFAPAAYVVDGGRTIVWVLGPLTNVAAALKAEPNLKIGIEEIIVAGAPDAKRAWNIRYDPDAYRAVRSAGIPLKFVIAGPVGQKPESWRQGDLSLGQGTSIGETFFNRLLADSQARAHYTEVFASFHDELVFLYHVDSAYFLAGADHNVLAPRDRSEIVKLFSRCLSSGRQHKHRVVFTDANLPAGVFREDLAERKDRIIAKNGVEEWFAQLVMNEVHQHLGAYSVIGVKMGLRAAELLNAPFHAITVVSHTAKDPPASCMNDGVIVSTGSTPGRGLFSHSPGPPGAVTVDFSFNGRRVTLTLKEEYRKRIGAAFQGLTDMYTEADAGYWGGVRQLGLDIWENWHRRDLFDVVVVTEGSRTRRSARLVHLAIRSLCPLLVAASIVLVQVSQVELRA